VRVCVSVCKCVLEVVCVHKGGDYRGIHHTIVVSARGCISVMIEI